jgi:O-succinylbenzoate synthase
MKITHVELVRVEIPLVTPFRTSFGTDTVRDALLVHVTTDDSEGWGECVADRAPLYSSEWADGAAEVIERFLLPRVLALGSDLDAEAVAPVLADVEGHPMAKGALEMAILDAQLSAADTSFAEFLGATRDRVDCGVSVGIQDDIPRLFDLVSGYLADGYRRIKLKIQPGADVAPVRAIRERFGDDLALQVDANAAYMRADAATLAALDPFGLLLIEQPLAPDDLVGHAQLARQLTTPICLDESITSARLAADAIELGACAIVNIKAGRVGGYLEARRVHDVCAARGVPVWCGGMLETGLGRAANVALAALPNFTLPGDTSASARYFARDLTEPFVLDAGRLAVPTGPGLGVEPLPDALRDFMTGRRTIHP